MASVPLLGQTLGQAAGDSSKPAGLDFWSFQPVKRSALPRVENRAWVQSPIDAFVLAKLEAAGLEPAKPAARRDLLRRVTVNLTGLLPTPEELRAFETDTSPQAWANAVERLLASPRYGERWGRHWLDVARYGDSNGGDENKYFPNANKYRDYVVDAFNRDQSFSEFVQEQIAGDLMPADEDPESARRRIIATGFLVIGTKILAEPDPRKMELDIIDEQIDTIGKAFMGLSIGCARCHDHKFDPISTKSYYSMAGIFKSTYTMEHYNIVADWHEREVGTATEMAALKNARDESAQLKKANETISREAREALGVRVQQDTAKYLLGANEVIARRRMIGEPEPLGPVAMERLAKGRGLLFEAEDFDRGNVSVDRDNYGKEIGIISDPGGQKNFAEYDIELPFTGNYQIELRYAALHARPGQLLIDGQVVQPEAVSKTTGGWMPEHQKWVVEGVFRLKAGKHVLRIQSEPLMSHIDKVLIIEAPLPKTNAVADADEGWAPRDLNQIAAEEGLVPVVLKNWADRLTRAEQEGDPLFHVWLEYAKLPRLTFRTEAKRLANDIRSGVCRPPSQAPGSEFALVRDWFSGFTPNSLRAVANHYRALFDEARGWEPAKATPEQKQLVEFVKDAKGPFALPEGIEGSFAEASLTQLKTNRERLAKIASTMPKLPTAMAVEDRKIEDLAVHIRGDYLTLGETAPRGVPMPFDFGERHRVDDKTSGRLQLARWLTDDEHPMTARVIANRVWHWHFGNGLVRTPDDFGIRGAKPTHPELLDWLASELIRSGWSIKHLHRLILRSSAYQMSTANNARAAEADPENTLLWRMNRRRMEAEVIHDSLLQMAGRLDLQMGGLAAVVKTQDPTSDELDRNNEIYRGITRRAIYVPVHRTHVYELFDAFDFPDPGTPTGRRNATNVATQALFFLNNDWLMQQAEALAKRSHGGPEKRVGFLYETTLGRKPSASELAAAMKFVERFGQALPESLPLAKRDEQSWAAFCQVLLQSNPFLYLN
ncbi:MAG: DUF1553 domain-containing protein [Verrucomicrobiales bacterium]|nr:DUF1553 domain-containing protein [Verrucomicrobiales bacterium]